jgi:hypothetical protein
MGIRLNLATTTRLRLIRTLHDEPLQAFSQPSNFEPSAGFAVSAMVAAYGNVAEHVPVQLMPEGELVTVPLPVPDQRIDSLRSVVLTKSSVMSFVEPFE